MKTRKLSRVRTLVLTLPLLCFASTALQAASVSVLGNWQTSTGSIVSISPCGDAICLDVAKVSPTAPGSTDKLNPDKALRSRSLCGLRIGDGFKPDGPDTASGGHIYDPESGRTYSAKMERKGDTLKLRGYVGISILGRTEVWNLTQSAPACH